MHAELHLQTFWFQSKFFFLFKHFRFKERPFRSRDFWFRSKAFVQTVWIKSKISPANIVVSKQSDLLVSKQDLCSNILVSKLEISADQYWKQDFFSQIFKARFRPTNLQKKIKINKRFPSNTFVSFVITNLSRTLS